MSKCTNAMKKVSFYDALASIIIDPDLQELEIDRLLVAYRDVRNCISLEITADVIRSAHREYHDHSLPTDTVDNLARAAFKDLTAHFRWPVARQVFDRFAEMSGTAGEDDLYASVISVRNLDEEGRFAAVTLVVDSREGFTALLERSKSPSYIHLV
jgi:hypothetical protein